MSAYTPTEQDAARTGGAVMRNVFAGAAALVAVLVVAEFYFAASGSFGTAPGAFRPHHVMGYVIFGAAAVTAVLGAAARVGWRLAAMPVLVAGLTGLQVLIATLARAAGADGAGAAVFGLHAVNGLAMLAVAGLTARRAWRARGA